MSRQVLVVQRRLPEYRVAFFEDLKAALDARGVRLSLVHGDPLPRERSRNDEGSLPWAIRVRNRYATVAGIPFLLQGIPASNRAGRSLIVLSHENAALTNYPILVRHRLSPSTRVAFWGHGPTCGPRLRQRLKRWTARSVDWWFAYTQLSVDRVVQAGFPADRITCLENAIDTRALQGWAASISDAERAALRQDLGIDGSHVAVALGSMTPEKHLPLLIRSADLLRRRIPDFHLVLVGSGPLRDLVEEAARTRPWMHPVGARHDREKALYCALAQVNLNPGMVGLGIVDSFALGLPLVTTRIDIHSPEIAYLEPGRNGLLTEPDAEEFAAAAERALTDDAVHSELVAGCRAAARRYTIENMVSNFAGGILRGLEVPIRRGRAQVAPGNPGTASSSAPASPVPPRVETGPISQAQRLRPKALRVAFIWRRYLPYHEARLVHLKRECERRDITLQPIEVASDDASYGFPARAPRLERHCCFPGSVYHRYSARELFREVRDTLTRFEPDVVFAPATPFPEGMAAIAYRNASGARTFLMDDAWHGSDRRGWLVRGVKCLIHRSVDGAFIPGPFHRDYFVSLGFNPDRIVYGMDAVDNDYFAQATRAARERGDELRASLSLPPRYFLFVGRFLARKGLRTLLNAYAAYRASHSPALPLLLAGGAESDLPRRTRLPEGAVALGRRFGQSLADLYGLADALVVPSLSDPWGLVVNEGMASGLPVIVSRGCGASSLVRDGVNGWTFAPGDTRELARVLQVHSELPEERRADMGYQSRKLVSEWGLERFTEGVLRALEIPRALPARGLASLAPRLWRGWVRVY